MSIDPRKTGRRVGQVELTWPEDGKRYTIFFLNDAGQLFADWAHLPEAVQRYAEELFADYEPVEPNAGMH